MFAASYREVSISLIMLVAGEQTDYRIFDLDPGGQQEKEEEEGGAGTPTQELEIQKHY